ncbi:TPA: CPBP family intramembrane metalloprotease, partial [Streptococcus agalactiae]|nr:CPBP family intramembrane metalloprotease [Streptococcus agalactiae]
MNQEKKRLNLIGLILLAQAIVLSLATTLFAEILQNDVWIGIA